MTSVWQNDWIVEDDEIENAQFQERYKANKHFLCKECFYIFQKSSFKPRACQHCHHYSRCHHTKNKRDHICPNIKKGEDIVPFVCPNFSSCPTHYIGGHREELKKKKKERNKRTQFVVEGKDISSLSVKERTREVFF